MSIGSGVRRSIVSGTVVLVTVAFVIGFSNAAQADQEPAASRTPVPVATSASPEATTTPISDASPTPAPSPTTDATAGAGTSMAEPLGGADPSLAVQNAARNHAMGSTIPTQSTSIGMRAFAAPETLAATAGPPGLPGLDVSGWQVLTRANWTTIYNNGARFAYVKATEGTSYTSSQFAEQYNDSYAAGLAHGAYHFATPNTSTGAAQANYFVRNGGGWSADGRTLPPLLDIEYNPYGATCYGLSQSAMVSWIQSFSSTMRSLTGRYPAIYSTTDWWTQCTGNSSAFANNPLFIARYTTSSTPGTLPASWSKYTFWQWADSGIFPGDQDVFNGSAAALTTLALGQTGSTTPSLADPNPVIGVGDINGDGKPDLVARRPDGTLWFYAGTGTVNSSSEGYASAVPIGSGWQKYNLIQNLGDLNGDGKPDLVARDGAGQLWFYAGNGKTGYQPPILIGKGWQIYSQIVGVGDVNGDGNDDFVGLRPDGTLWLYLGTGAVSTTAEGYRPAVQISSAFAGATIVGIGDLNRDGRPDLLERTSTGAMLLFPGTRTATGALPYFGSAIPISAGGLAAARSIVAPGDFNGDGFPDILGIASSGALTFYQGRLTIDEGYKSGMQNGTSGWSAYRTVVATGDFNGDSKPDLLGVRTDGTLWFYAGTGAVNTSDDGYRPAVKNGNGGWQVYTNVLAAENFDGRGKADLIAVRNDGTLWFYSGTGMVTATQNGYAPAQKIGNGGWQAFSQLVTGDFNGDGKQDILGIGAGGSLWFWAGTQTTTGTHPYYLPAVELAASGWSYSKLVSVGDFNGDGRPDLVLAKSDGTLWIAPGTGRTAAGTTGFGTAVKIGTGWSAYSVLVGPGDFNGDGKPDMLGVRSSNGSLWFYAGLGNSGNSTPALSSGIPIGSGWTIYG